MGNLVEAFEDGLKCGRIQGYISGFFIGLGIGWILHVVIF